MEKHRQTKNSDVLYLGIHQILYPKMVWLVATPHIVASGNDVHEVCSATEADLSEQLDFGDEVHLLAWVLEVNRYGSTPVREWTVAPTGLRLTSINHQTGEVKSRVRDTEVVEPQSIPRRPEPVATFRPQCLMRLSPGSEDQPIFVGLRQSLQPQSTALVSAPEVLAIAEDHDSVISEVKARYEEQNELSTLCTFKFWALEAHQGWSHPQENWLVAPHGIEVVNDSEPYGRQIQGRQPDP